MLARFLFVYALLAAGQPRFALDTAAAPRAADATTLQECLLSSL